MMHAPAIHRVLSGVLRRASEPLHARSAARRRCVPATGLVVRIAGAYCLHAQRTTSEQPRKSTDHLDPVAAVLQPRDAPPLNLNVLKADVPQL